MESRPVETVYRVDPVADGFICGAGSVDREVASLGMPSDYKGTFKKSRVVSQVCERIALSADIIGTAQIEILFPRKDVVIRSPEGYEPHTVGQCGGKRRELLSLSLFYDIDEAGQADAAVSFRDRSLFQDRYQLHQNGT